MAFYSLWWTQAGPKKCGAWQYFFFSSASCFMKLRFVVFVELLVVMKVLEMPEKSKQLLTKANALAMVVSNIYRNNIMILDGGALIVRKFLLALHAIVYAFWFVFSQSPSFSARSSDRLIFFRLSKVHCYARPKPSRCNFHAIQIRRLVRKRDEAKAEKLRKVVATRFLFLLELFLGISSFRMFGFFLIPPKGIKSGERRDL